MRTQCPLCIVINDGLSRGLLSPSNHPLTTIFWDCDRGFHFGPDNGRLVFLANEATRTASLPPGWIGRRVEPVLDPMLIKKWLSLCEEHHDDGHCRPITEIITRRKKQKLLKTLRVIDVASRQIVTAPRGCRYVALSYLWGGGGGWRLTTANREYIRRGLLNNEFYQDFIPKTIRDAMELVAKIGERYLWVDSFCLIQDDPVDMADGIQHMDLVYEGATLTIVAAAGFNNYAGLPGLHPGTRSSKQLWQQIEPGLEVATARPLYDLLSRTRYMTRGWTYVLSVVSGIIITH